MAELEKFQPPKLVDAVSDAAAKSLVSDLKGRPLTAEQMEQAAAIFDAKVGRPGAFKANVLPKIPSNMLPSAAPAAAAPPKPSAGVRAGGIRTGESVPDWTTPYGSSWGYQAPTSRGISRRGQE